jgi:molecular chaperone GrpE
MITDQDYKISHRAFSLSGLQFILSPPRERNAQMDDSQKPQKNDGDDQGRKDPAIQLDPARQDPAASDPVASADEPLKAETEKARHYYDQWVRTMADLENYKKRAARERQEAIRFANENLIEKLIPILDNFDMAVAATSAPNASLQSVQAGISMIYQQLKNSLSEAGLEEIDASNKPFDPNWHEAVSQQATDEVPEGQVVQQLRKGYKLRDRLIRPAGVVVAKKPSA